MIVPYECVTCGAPARRGDSITPTGGITAERTPITQLGGRLDGPEIICIGCRRFDWSCNCATRMPKIATDETAKEVDNAQASGQANAAIGDPDL